MKAIIFFSFLSFQIFAQTWIGLPDFPGIARDDGVAVEVDGKAYVGTGLQTGWTLSGDFFVMDLVTHTWSNIAPLPAGSERQYACAFKGPSSFYVFGGDGAGGALNTLYKYSSTSNTWSQMSSKPGAGIYGAVIFEFGDKVILFGGRFAGGIVNHEIWEYSIGNDSWLQKNDVLAVYGGRWRACATVFQGKGYCLFGIDTLGAWRKEFLEYTPSSDTWQQLPSPPSTPSKAYASLQALNDRLIFFGGIDSLNTYSGSLTYFNLGTSNWSQGPAFPTMARRGGMSWTHNNRYYYTCGLDSTETRLNETWMLDLTLGWQKPGDETSIQLKPNPFYDELLIQLDTKPMNFHLSLLDCSGKNHIELCPAELTETGVKLNTENLELGLYILLIQIEGQLPLRKKIVKR